MQNELDSGYILSFIKSFIILMAAFVFLVFVSDYYQVMNLKEEADNIVERVIATEMEKQIDDEALADREISFDLGALKTSIIDEVEVRANEKLKSSFTITNLTVEATDKFYFYYDGMIRYKPMFLNLDIVPEDYDTEFQIKVDGRKKVQRFDWEDRLDGSVITDE